MKMYSTPSLSWLLLGRVVSAVSLNRKKKKGERCRKQYNANQLRKHRKAHNPCAILSVEVPALLTAALDLLGSAPAHDRTKF